MSLLCETYTLPPARFKHTLDVAGVCCAFEGKILLLQRSVSSSQPGTWTLPAGKVEKGEDFSSAACRELFEETNITVDKEKTIYLMKLYCRQPSLDYIFHGFACLLESMPQVVLHDREHSSHVWMTLEEALKMPLIGGGQCALRQYQKLWPRIPLLMAGK